MASAGLVVGLIVAVGVGILLIVCCFRSIVYDKEKLMRQIKQVRGVNDVDMDDIEASVPPSEEHPAETKEHHLDGQQHAYGQESGLPDDHKNTAFVYSQQQQQGIESDGR